MLGEQQIGEQHGVVVEGPAEVTDEGTDLALEALLGTNSFEGLSNLPDLPDLATNLSAADLAFGEEQMAKMVKDRPEFTRYISKDDPV